MIKKLFRSINSQSASITSAAIIIGSLSLVSRFLGIFRDRILASQFGAGNILDAYYAAFRLPDLVYNLLILGAVSAGLIPVFTALLSKNQKEDAWKLINSIINILSVGLIIICSALFISAPWLMPFITPGFSPEKMRLVVGLSQIMFLSPIFLGLSAIFSSILQSFRKFVIYSIAPLFYNLGIIIGAVYLVKPFGPYGLAWGVVLGAVMHLIVQMWPTFTAGYRYTLDFNWRDKYVIKVAKLMIPRTLTLMVNQINFLIDTMVASTLAIGSLAVFNLSNNLQNFPLGLFSVSFAVAALPVLAVFAAKEKMKDFVATISTTLRQILFFIVPISVLLYVMRAQIVRVLLGAGRFNWEDTRLTAACLGIFCIGLFAQGAFPLIVRGFYALNNTRTPFYISLVVLVVNRLALFFFKWLFSFDNWFTYATVHLLRISDLSGISDFRILALPMAVTISAILEIVLLMIWLRKIIGRLDGRKIIDSSYRIIFASLGAGLIAYGSLMLIDMFVPTEKVWGIFLQGAVAGVAGILGYWLLAYVFRMEEMTIFFASLKRKLFKSAKVIAEDDMAGGEIS
ncbi:MAG: murein biosynthesis integral membrane protein MurJ [Patescibacteria group bacterium]